ncbi:DUF1127 domain-containing protein [Salinarimonas soli]|uniref:DUF1127 domain-containing protein n=1 Tax=Salinarimonas soli TaxID=1638099 RepID=A0A5B2VAA6_9HYPH|nr:DUF1127 domain-containing protein [Salinarimonas soli]KAA2236453.1 DUF1127 domain-containing protein [Salinarimonas soli]
MWPSVAYSGWVLPSGVRSPAREPRLSLRIDSPCAPALYDVAPAGPEWSHDIEHDGLSGRALHEAWAAPASLPDPGWRAHFPLWVRRHRTRRQLRDLSSQELADLGLDEVQRRAQCTKRLWRS